LSGEEQNKKSTGWVGIGRRLFYKIDFTLVVLVLALSSLGLIFIYNASSILAELKFGDQYYYLKRQGLTLLSGIFLMGLLSQIPYTVYKKLTPILLAATILFLSLLFVPGLGVKAHGAVRWLKLPLGNLQVSEPIKIFLILYLAHYFSKRVGQKNRSQSRMLVPVVTVVFTVLGLILLQPDFGTAVTIALVALSMLVAFGLKIRYIVVSLILLSPAIYFLILKVDYRRRRLLSFLDPWADPADSGFQIIQSYVAFFNGKMTGLGLGQGHQSRLFLPEIHTDFIFSVIGEEMGFIGCMVVLIIFFMLISKLFALLLSVRDPFGQLVVFGLTGLIAIQCVINLGVVTGLLPTKGLPLPFVSYGRSALLTNFAAMGIVLNIAKRT
jgi:cell division protein FtsW